MVEEVTTTSWFTRIKNALIGIFFGMALIVAAIILIFWNESHGLHWVQSLNQAQKILVNVPDAPINPQNNLKVVYFNGVATTKDILDDALLDMKVPAISLNRKVEMYQWQEQIKTKKESRLGGAEREVKTYSYNKGWYDHLIDSAHFKEQETHQNPSLMPVKSKLQYANKVTVGDFLLPDFLVKQIAVSTPVTLSEKNGSVLKAQLNKPVKWMGEALYFSKNPQALDIGDIKIAVSAVYPQPVSIIAQQSGGTLQAYRAPAGESVALISTGVFSSAQMIQDALSSNNVMTWLLRGASLILLIIGFCLILRPLAVLASVLPFLGDFVGLGTGFLGLTLGAGLWLIITAFAWFATRPILSASVIGFAVLFGYLLIRLRNKKIYQSPSS